MKSKKSQIGIGIAFIGVGIAAMVATSPAGGLGFVTLGLLFIILSRMKK